MTTGTSSDAADGPPRPSGRSSRPPGPARTAASSSTSSTEAIEAGRVGRPHGLDGSFHVTRPEPDLLRADVPVVVAGRRREVVRRAGTDARPILRLAGVGSREAAEALRGEPLWVQRADAPPLEDGEYWADDLVGLLVVDGAREVGRVERVRALPSCEVLEVGELLIPLVSDAVRDVNLARGRIDVDLAFLGAA
jgi:16S rRNA processing protein RimM